MVCCLDDSSDKFSGDAQIGTMLSGHKDFYNPDRKPQHMTPNHINSTVMPTGMQPETVPRAVAPNPRCRMTRKLSCDSLYDYKTYQMPEPSELRDCNMFDGGGRMDDDIRSGSRRTPTGTTSMPYSAMTLARSQPRALTKQASVGTTPREVHLAKAPLHIRKEAFKLYQPIMMPSDTKRGVNGLVLCHIFCGHGLVSSRAALQDLYTVIEIDSLGCARTTVHTGAMNFDWDDRIRNWIEQCSDVILFRLHLGSIWTTSTRLQCVSDSVHTGPASCISSTSCTARSERGSLHGTCLSRGRHALSKNSVGAYEQHFWHRSSVFGWPGEDGK